MNDWQTCVGNCQPIKTRSIYVIFVTLHKMADGRVDDREATFQFIEEVQNCPDGTFRLQHKTQKTSKKMEEQV